MAEVAFRESSDFRLVVLAVDGTRLTPPLVAPCLALSVPVLLLLAFTVPDLVGVEDPEDVDVAGDFTRLNARGLGSYMLVRRPLVAAAFCAASSLTGLSHFTTLALGPRIFEVASLLPSLFSPLFLLPSFPCLVELGWLSSSKSPVLCLFGSPPAVDSRLAEESRPQSTLAEACKCGDIVPFVSGSTSISSLLLLRSLLKKLGSFAEILFDCFLLGLSAFLP